MGAAPLGDALEAGRVLFSHDCTFIAGAATLDALPPPVLPEAAFAGRSNAGKSSLLNALTGRAQLARVSATPGRTRQINFFQIAGRLMLADLPGYGFARASKAEAARWNALAFGYLRDRPNLRRVILLIDARRGLMKADLETMGILDKAAVSYQIVLTKSDLVMPERLAAVSAATRAASSRHGAAHPEIVATSASTGLGIAELRAELAALAAPPAP